MGPPPALAGRQAFRRGARFALPRQKPRPDFRQQTGQGTTTRRAIYVDTTIMAGVSVYSSQRRIAAVNETP